MPSGIIEQKELSIVKRYSPGIPLSPRLLSSTFKHRQYFYLQYYQYCIFEDRSVGPLIHPPDVPQPPKHVLYSQYDIHAVSFYATLFGK